MAFFSSASVWVVSQIGVSRFGEIAVERDGGGKGWWKYGYWKDLTKLCVRVGRLCVDGVFDGLVVGLHGDFGLPGAALVVVVLDFSGRDVLGAHDGCVCGWSGRKLSGDLISNRK